MSLDQVFLIIAAITIANLAAIFLVLGIIRVRLQKLSAVWDELQGSEHDRERNLGLSLFARHTSRGILVCDAKGQISWCNEAFSKITGYESGELFDFRGDDKIPDTKGNKRAIAQILSQMRRGKASQAEVEAKSKAGDTLWLKLDVIPVMQGETLNQYVVLVENASKAHATEASMNAIQLENDRLALTAHMASEGMAILDEHFQTIWINDSMGRISGYSLEELQEKGLEERLIGPLTDKKTYVRIMKDTQDLKPTGGEVQVYNKVGDPIWVEARHTPLFENGNFAGYVIVHRDTTDRKTLEIELTAHRDELAKRVEQRTQTVRNQSVELAKALDRERELNRQQSEFVSVVSHEFRTPLTIIDGTARRIERSVEKLSSDEVKERAENIRNTVKRMTVLVERTLDATRVSSGRIKVVPSDFNLRNLIREVVIRQSEVAPDYRIKLEISEIPDVIYGDPNLLDNVFTNLVSNAVKYSGSSRKIDISAEIDDGFIVIKVKDYGLGIPAEEIPKLFQRFFRASTSSGIPGTGIGLNLVKSLIEMHYGRVSLSSHENSWTEVTVELPIESPLRDQSSIPGTEVSTNDLMQASAN